MQRLGRVTALAAMALAATAAVALSQVRGERPPADGMPLPALLTEIQTRENVAWFDEVNWDDDGYWEIEFGRADGGRVEIRVDPVSGKNLTR